ncbi:zinc ribbon domain-containing protein [Kordia algicida OT-1]|nr:zinc ribbon domain-containing protein [Kordia algicida]
MHCPNCNTEVKGIQQFCINCGTNLFPSKQTTTSKSSDTFIMIFLGYLLFNEIISFAIRKFVPNWYEAPAQYGFILLSIIGGATIFLLAAAIKDKQKKTFAFVIAGVHMLYILYMNIDWLMTGF